MFFRKTLLTTTILITTISLALIGKSALANKNTVTNDVYTIKIIDNCQVISEIPLNPKQVQAYLALQHEENKMAKLQAPITGIEEQLRNYSQQIEQLSQQIFTNSKQPLQINKAVLAKQELVVGKLDNLMEKHQADFDALSAQGRYISKIADKFTQLVAPLIAENEDYNISIGHRDDNPINKHCNNNMASVRLTNAG